MTTPAKTTSIAPFVVQSYIDKNRTDSDFDKFLADNKGWDQLIELSDATFHQIAYSPNSLAQFFQQAGVYQFVPEEERAKTQGAITAMATSVETLITRWEQLRQRHAERTGAFTEQENYEELLELGMEYTSLSDRCSGLLDTLVDYLYGVRQTTEQNIIAAEKAAEALPAEEAAPAAEAVVTQGN